MNTFLSAPSPTPSRPDSDRQAKSCKAIVFHVAGQWFALPATAILKVIPISVFGEPVPTSHLVLWDNRPLVWLDLHPLLAQPSLPRAAQPAHFLPEPQKPEPQTLELQKPEPQKYVLIAWSPTGDRCAIPVDELPTLMEMPLSEVQPLPPNYRQTINSIARYMVTHTHRGSVFIVLLLDLQQAITWKHSLKSNFPLPTPHSPLPTPHSGDR